MSTYYYINDKNEATPVISAQRLNNLYYRGHIKDDTLVSIDGNEWITYAAFAESEKSIISRIANSPVRIPKIGKATATRALSTALMVDIISYFQILGFILLLFFGIVKDIEEMIAASPSCLVLFVMIRAKADELRLLHEIKQNTSRAGSSI